MPGALDPTRALGATARTSGWLPDAPRADASSRGAHRAPIDAQPPQNTKTRLQPPQRPNRPSTCQPLLTEGWTREAHGGTVNHGERVL